MDTPAIAELIAIATNTNIRAALASDHPSGSANPGATSDVSAGPSPVGGSNNPRTAGVVEVVAASVVVVVGAIVVVVVAASVVVVAAEVVVVAASVVVVAAEVVVVV